MDGPYYRGGPPPPSRQQQQQQQHPQEPPPQQEGFWSRLTNKIFAGSEEEYVHTAFMAFVSVFPPLILLSLSRIRSRFESNDGVLPIGLKALSLLLST